MEDNQEQLAPQPISSEPPQSLPQSQKPTIRELLLLLIVIFSSLAVVGGVIYVQNINKSQIATVAPTQVPQIISSPTPDSTANWKTYSSLEYGFSIMYPYDWFIWEQIPGVSTISLSNKKEGFNIDKTDGVVVTINPEGSDLFDVLSKLKPTEKLTKDLVIYTKIEDIKIGNSSAVQFSADRKAIPGDGLISGDEILIQKKNIVLSVRLLGGSQEAVEMNKQIFNQILQTFRFLDSGVNGLQVCPDTWLEFLSPIQAKENPYYGQKGQFITINDSLDLIPAEKFDINWIKQNCEIKEPEPVG